jgi:DNA-binding GntR family transcriptional regulator
LQRPKSLAEQAADQIRARIIRGEFELGAALSETTLATEMGVSKTPIREAFLRLKTEGLVDVQPQRGTFVFQMNEADVRDLSDFREVLETAALGFAMRRDARALGKELCAIATDMKGAVAERDVERYKELDGQFHRRIIEHAENSYLANCYDTITFRVRALRNRLAQLPDQNARSLEEHRVLANAVGRGEAVKARTFLSKHIGVTASEYTGILRQSATK